MVADGAIAPPSVAVCNRPRLKIVIVNYRTPLLVNECVDSLKAYSARGATTTIVVVDNGSGDGSPTLIRAAHPDITLIDAGGNLGFAKANNLVLRELDADYALLINSDTRVELGTLDRMVEALQADPAIGVVGPRLVNMGDGEDQDYPTQFPTIGEMLRRVIRGPRFPASGQDRPLEVERVHGACMMTRAAVLIGVGLLDEGFFIYDEDADWCIRVHRAGWRLQLLPDIRVRHHGGQSTGNRPNGQRVERVLPSETSLRMRYELRHSRYRLYRKHRNSIETALLKLFTDAFLVIDSIAWLARGVISAKCRPAATAVMRCNLRIIRLNPFGLKITQ